MSNELKSPPVYPVPFGFREHPNDKRIAFAPRSRRKRSKRMKHRIRIDWHCRAFLFAMPMVLLAYVCSFLYAWLVAGFRGFCALPESPIQSHDRPERFWVLKAMSKGEWVAIVHRSLSASGGSQRMAVISDVSGANWRFPRLSGEPLSGGNCRFLRLFWNGGRRVSPAFAEPFDRPRKA